MEFLKKYKMAIIGVVLAVVLFAVYSMYRGDQLGDVFVREEADQGNVAERELLALLLSLRSVELDGSLLESSEFISLVDISQALPSEPVGRTNPFAPF